MKVRIFGAMTSMLLFGLLVTAGARKANADIDNRDTKLTFSAPVEIPGMVLIPGTYEFRLADPVGVDSSLVEVLDSRGRALALVQACPEYHLSVSDKTVVKLEKRGPGNPEAIKEWIYPDLNYSLEFVYPAATGKK